MASFKLVFDTATERGIVALFSDTILVAKQELAVGLSNSKTLLPAIDALLKKAGIEPSQLELVAVGRGPGSYTGIRVAVACAKALSVALQIPLIGVSSLRGYVPEETDMRPFFSVIDARIGGVYLIQGQRQGKKVLFSSEEQLVPFEKFVEQLQEDSLIVTPSKQILETRLQKCVHTIFERVVSVEVLLDEAEQQYQAGQYSIDGTLSLLYLRE